MPDLWPALCTAAALIFLLVLIIRCQVHAFLGLLIVSLGLGLATGMEPVRVVDVIGKGVGDILRDVAVILALGAMLGRMLEVSGAAEVIARTLVNAFGEKRAPLAILLAGFLIGIPVLFNVAFLLLMPVMWRLQRQTGQSLLYYLLPLAFSLGLTHSLVPPHPGIVGAINILGGPDTGGTMVLTIIFGSLLSLPLMFFGWYGPGLFWARRQHVEAPAQPAATQAHEATSVIPDREPILPAVPFGTALLIVTMPLILSLAGFGAKLADDLYVLPSLLTEPLLEMEWLASGLFLRVYSPLAWLQFLGKPTIALSVPTILAFWLLGLGRGLKAARLAKLAEEGLRDVGGILFLFAAAGGFKEVIQATGAGDVIADYMMKIPGPSPVAIAYLVAAMTRVALGSATVSILTAATLVQGLVPLFPGTETLLVLAVASGVTLMTQPADSGFWMLKEFGNLSASDVMLRFNACRILMSLAGLAILLAAEALLG